MLVVSIGCPAGIGPEVSVLGAARLRGILRVLVGDEATILEAADRVGVPRRKFSPFGPSAHDPRRIYIHAVGPRLRASDREPGRPSRVAGAVQLLWLDAAYELVRAEHGRALVTAPVNKAAIARSGAPGARQFKGHTEWLEARDGARRAVMCFAAPEFSTSLVTTHLALRDVPKSLSSDKVSDATLGLAQLSRALGTPKPRLAVCSLNPHAGEDGMFGDEEKRAIVPGIQAARKALGRRAEVDGPVGAETAFRKALAHDYDGVVAMYHDQATIPMKLLSFGSAVNVTMGLRIVRTSVDHGTGYDIAWQGRADPSGMVAALELGARLLRPKRAAR